MPYTSAEKDLDRARSLRAMKKGRGNEAARGLEEAALRLESRAVRKLNQVGRKRRKRSGSSASNLSVS